jgi:flavin reductase (DIM6/NTAB) family NADH-FMN oxidoreductase RutF
MPSDITPTIFRRVMSRFPTGVTVVTAGGGGNVRGMTANAFMSGSLEPPLCVVSVAKRANMHAALLAAEHFGVSILARDQEELSIHFAGGPEPASPIRLEQVGPVALLREASARIAAENIAHHDCGDHTIFIGRIFHMEASDRLPLVYHASRYATLVHRPGERDAPEFW